MRYTEAQRQAIAAVDPNLQIIACAGSGKTQVVAARAVNILSQPGVHPRNIVAFTFTEKAAAELKGRITEIANAQLGPVEGMAEMYVGTIHGFCLDFLQTYLYEFLRYSVLSGIQTDLFIARNSSKSGLTDVEVVSGPSAGKTLKRSSFDVKVFVAALNVIREDRVDPEELPDSLRRALDCYTELLDRHSYLDFARIQHEAVRALTDTSDPNCLLAQQHVADRVHYVIVDEYQDVNPLQERLVRRLHELGANICVVGDDDQTIYQWRGSEVRNILEFAQRYPDVVSVKMGENFRSSPGVVEAARRIAEHNHERLDKPVRAAGHQPFDYGDLLALTFDDPEQEARWIVERIRTMRGVPFQDRADAAERGLDWSDFAVLLRSVRHSAEPIVEALRAADVPFIIVGFSNLFDTDEVQACVSLFDYVVGEADESEVRQTWTKARIGVTDEELTNGMAVLDEAKIFDTGERWSVYNIQRVFLRFLEAIELREEKVPPTPDGDARGEIIYCNLGKFSQVISDFEQIHFQSQPQDKYDTFVKWLHREAPDYYEEGTDAEGFAQPNAVQIMTVHQAKGMEWPAVFLPAMQRNRFPASKKGGRNKWHILPREAVDNDERYDGSTQDERRLFYVALTRSKRYLFATYAPNPGNSRYNKHSKFFFELTGSEKVLTRDPGRLTERRITPQARKENPPVVLSFSELKYFFECPYQFKLRFLYGFNPPLHEALGYGKSLHDALAEMHRRAIEGDIVADEEIEELVDRHFYTPFAYPELRRQLHDAAVDAVDRYLARHRDTLPQVEHAEKQVEVQVDPQVTVNGRVDLIKRLDTGDVSIVDFKSTERAQEEEVTRDQLHTYAIGYHDLTGEDADMIEVLNLDERGQNKRELVDTSLLDHTRHRIRQAGDAVRERNFERLEHWCGTCEQCDLAGICRSRTDDTSARNAAPAGRSPHTPSHPHPYTIQHPPGRDSPPSTTR